VIRTRKRRGRKRNGTFARSRIREYERVSRNGNAAVETRLQSEPSLEERERERRHRRDIVVASPGTVYRIPRTRGREIYEVPRWRAPARDSIPLDSRPERGRTRARARLDASVGRAISLSASLIAGQRQSVSEIADNPVGDVLITAFVFISRGHCRSARPRIFYAALRSRRRLRPALRFGPVLVRERVEADDESLRSRESWRPCAGDLPEGGCSNLAAFSGIFRKLPWALHPPPLFPGVAVKRAVVEREAWRTRAFVPRAMLYRSSRARARARRLHLPALSFRQRPASTVKADVPLCKVTRYLLSRKLQRRNAAISARGSELNA